MPSFESIRPFKKSRASSVLVSADNDSDRNSLSSCPPYAEGSGKVGILKKTWKRCKRPASALIAKHVAQPILAKASLLLLSSSLYNPTPSTIDFSMRMTLTLPVAFQVLIESMLVRLYRDGHSPEDPFLELTLPACEIRRSTDIEIDGKTTRILNIAQFGDFIGDFMFNESVMLRVCGSAKAHFSGIRSRLQMDDHVIVTGLNTFPGYVIKSCQLLIPKAPDGALLEAVLDLPNPSLATIEMGDLTLDLYIGPVVVGEVFIPNVTFAPGPNIVTSRVHLDTKTAMSNLRTIIQSQKELLRHGKLGVKVSGKSTRRNGENLVYFEKALSKLQLYSQVPLSRVLGNTVGGIATSIAPGNLLTLLRMTGIMAILQGNGLDLAQLTQLDQPPPG